MPQHEQLSLRIARPEPNVNDVQQQTNARIDQGKHHRGAAILSGAELQASSQPRTNKCVPQAAVRQNIMPMSINEVFAAQPNGYVISVATAAHADLLERCIAMGKPILCEKPISDDLRETAHEWRHIQRLNGS